MMVAENIFQIQASLEMFLFPLLKRSIQCENVFVKTEISSAGETEH